MADTSIKYGYIWKFLDGSNTVDADNYTINSLGTNQNYLLNYSIGGISIDSMYAETQEANNTDSAVRKIETTHHQPTDRHLLRHLIAGAGWCKLAMGDPS